MRVVFLLLLLAVPSPARADEQHLPPIDSVRMLREARIAEMTGDTKLALEILARAAEAFPGEITPVVALFR